MIISILPSSLPDGTNGVPYTPITFTASGGTPDYTWSLVPGSQLPSGLAIFGTNVLGATPVLEGTPNGNPTGTYDVTIQLTDSALPANVVIMPYTITIH